MKIVSALIAVLSLALGLLLSDFVTLKGFPFNRYLIELHHDESPEASFRCNKLAAVLGENLSVFDPITARQTRCFILATGTPGAAGDFVARLGWNTWVSRVTHWSRTVEVPAASIKAISRN